MKLTVEKLVEIIKEQLPRDPQIGRFRDEMAAVRNITGADYDASRRDTAQRSAAANAERLKANAYDQDDIDQLRLMASNANQNKAIDFLFGGDNSGIRIAHDPSELQPLEQFNNSDLFKVISDLGFEASDGQKIFDAANKLFHKNFVSVVEEMATGFQLSQNSDGSLSLKYKFGDAEKMKRVMTRYIKKAILAAGSNLGIDRSLLARAKSALGIEETKMKFTQEQVLSIIKEEIDAVLSEDAEGPVESAIRRAADGYSEFYELVDAAMDADPDVDAEEVQDIVYKMLKAGVDKTDNRYLIAVDEDGETVELDLEDMDSEVWGLDDDRWQEASFKFVQN